MNDIGKHIKALRKENNLSQEALAQQLHVTRQAVSQWETGHTQPDIDTLNHIAQVCNTDILSVIYGKKQYSGLNAAQRKHTIKRILIFGLPAITMLGLSIWFMPYAQEQLHSSYQLMPYYIYSYVVRPLIYLLLCLALLNGASLLWRIEIKNLAVKRILVSASIVFLCFYVYCSVSSFVPALANITLDDISVGIAGLPVLFLLPGIGFFLGMQKNT